MISSRARALLLTVGVGLVACAVVVLGMRALPDVTRSRLPGAAGGSHTYTVTAEFRDALDLVPNSTVRVADVPVGRVTDITVARGSSGYVARATLQVSDSMHLPSQTVATISSTSLLGEKYVALVPPAHGSGSLRATGAIPLARTSDDIEVEQLLSSIGALLNGGGLQQLSTITEAFSTALKGHEQDTRHLLGDLDTIVGQLDRGRPALLSAIDSSARLMRLLSAQNKVIATSIDDLDPATGVLASQVGDLRKALSRLDRLSGRATGFVRRSTADTVADLKALAPVLQQVGKVADQLPRNLTLLVTYPFADTAVPAFSGAYGAFKGSVVIGLNQLLAAIAPTTTGPNQPFQPDGTPASAPASPSATSPLSALTQQLAQQLGLPDIVGGLGKLLSPRAGGAR
ncbi:MAG: MCE family protein [Nocardioidaceae bacterium]|nr:MCE family protein [Nocardioidaceae bacterium]MCL2612442.1 MCE family protein [Nocardioidaceae bacterium]